MEMSWKKQGWTGQKEGRGGQLFCRPIRHKENQEDLRSEAETNKEITPLSLPPKTSQFEYKQAKKSRKK
jgi:hypothetical protein